jgi:hypothetical protein
MLSQMARRDEIAAIPSVRADGGAGFLRRDLQTLATWSNALILILISLVIRLIYLVWFCPYQLLGDEAYYWEQARHFDLCYNEKGPVLAWMIRACCDLFGDREWVVRLPVSIASAIAAWGVGKLAMNVTRGDQRVGFFAVLCFLLIPAFQANAIICTQDGILIALWIGLTGIGLRLFRRWHTGESTMREWLLLWVALGFGVILKQSTLVFLPSVVLYAWIERRNLRFTRALIWQPILGAIIITLICTPMIVWNARHGWPMLAHTLGHLGAGGDQAGRVNRGNPVQWMSGVVGAVIGAIGPVIVIMLWASRRRIDDRRRDWLWLSCAAWPSVAFFILLALRKPVVPSWPLPSMVPLVILVAEAVVLASTRWIRWAWWATLAYGVAGCFFVAYPTVLPHLPIIGPRFQKSLIVRFTGHREDAAELEQTLATIKTPDGQPPLIVARHYMQAGLYRFYLPDHPTCFTAGKYLGKRSTTFDQWADTNMENPQLLGRTLLLDGEGDVPWEQALLFDRREPIGGGKYFLAFNYRGPNPNHPRMTADD